MTIEPRQAFPSTGVMVCNNSPPISSLVVSQSHSSWNPSRLLFERDGNMYWKRPVCTSSWPYSHYSSKGRSTSSPAHQVKGRLLSVHGVIVVANILYVKAKEGAVAYYTAHTNGHLFECHLAALWTTVKYDYFVDVRVTGCPLTNSLGKEHRWLTVLPCIAGTPDLGAKVLYFCHPRLSSVYYMSISCWWKPCTRSQLWLRVGSDVTIYLTSHSLFCLAHESHLIEQLFSALWIGLKTKLDIRWCTFWIVLLNARVLVIP